MDILYALINCSSVGLVLWALGGANMGLCNALFHPLGK